MSYAALANKSAAAPVAKTAAKAASSNLRIGEVNDAFEQEADRVADEVLAGGGTKLGWSLSQMTIGAPLQRKCSCGGSGAEAQCAECREKTLQRKTSGAVSPVLAPMIVRDVLSSPGQPLDEATRNFFETRFGHDFSKVRIHNDAKAADSAKAVGALAYTVGHQVAFASGQHQPHTTQGRKLLAHELAHTVQQSGSSLGTGLLSFNSPDDAMEREASEMARTFASPAGHSVQRRTGSAVLQRYEAGEHAQFGETGKALRELIAERARAYTASKQETLKEVSVNSQISEEDLRLFNPNLRHWPDPSHPGEFVEGFEKGDRVVIPPTMNPATRQALKKDEMTFTINDESLTYGEGIAMGDFFQSPEEMISDPTKMATEKESTARTSKVKLKGAAPARLKKLKKLIQKEKGAMLGKGEALNADDWEDATGGKFAHSLLENEAHFAPHDADLSKGAEDDHSKIFGRYTRNHKAEWETHHLTALIASQKGDLNKALATNAFADHFLTDAFSAGHLINKRDVMAEFAKWMSNDSTKTKFIKQVAAKAFHDEVKEEFSKYEASENPAHPDISREFIFVILLEGIYKDAPELVQNGVASYVHDQLNKDGVDVQNARGDQWVLQGDQYLNKACKECDENASDKSLVKRREEGRQKTLEIGRKAVAQSQLNVLDVFKRSDLKEGDVRSLFKKVWDFVPRPANKVMVRGYIRAGTDPESVGLIDAVVNIIKKNYPAIIAEIVNRGKLRKNSTALKQEGKPETKPEPKEPWYSSPAQGK